MINNNKLKRNNKKVEKFLDENVFVATSNNFTFTKIIKFLFGVIWLYAALFLFHLSKELLRRFISTSKLKRFIV